MGWGENRNQPNSKGEYVLFLCSVVVGNVYIISRETDYTDTVDGDTRPTIFNKYDYRYPDGVEKAGRALKAGFDAHYACVSEKLHYHVPACGRTDSIDCDELVVKDEKQIMPICKVYFKVADV